MENLTKFEHFQSGFVCPAKELWAHTVLGSTPRRFIIPGFTTLYSDPPPSMQAQSAPLKAPSLCEAEQRIGFGL